MSIKTCNFPFDWIDGFQDHPRRKYFLTALVPVVPGHKIFIYITIERPLESGAYLERGFGVKTQS